MIYIVIPVFNRLAFTIDCITSLQQQTYKYFKIILVDDGSTDGTASFIKNHFPSVIVIKGNGNLWWTGATNLGVKKALEFSISNDDYILTLNNDLIVKEDYLFSLLKVANKFKKSIIGSVSVNINDFEKVHYAGTNWNSKTAKYRPALQHISNYSDLSREMEVIETDMLPGRGVLIPINVFSKIGLYDDKAFPHYMADEDFSLRARKNGYRLLISVRSVVMSYVNETGLRKEKRNLFYYFNVFTSIRSPVNAQNRWNWAWRHATIFAPAYFAVDFLRITKSLIFKKQAW